MTPHAENRSKAHRNDSAVIDDFDSVFDTLCNDYLTLQWHWREFKTLFAEDVRRVDMMNTVASGFFAMVQRLMLNEIVLGMARITDNEKSARHKNLCLKQIPTLLPSCLSNHADEIRGLAENAENLIKEHTFRNWRSKKIAHRDFDHALGRNNAPFSADVSQIEACISAIHAVLNRTSVVVRNQELHPEVMAESDHGNADAILAVLIKVDGLESLELDDGQPSNIDP